MTAGELKESIENAADGEELKELRYTLLRIGKRTPESFPLLMSAWRDRYDTLKAAGRLNKRKSN